MRTALNSKSFPVQILNSHRSPVKMLLLNWLTAAPHISRIRLMLLCVCMPMMRTWFEPLMDMHSVLLLTTTCISMRLLVLAILTFQYVRLRRAGVAPQLRAPCYDRLMDCLRTLVDALRTQLARALLLSAAGWSKIVVSMGIVLTLYELDITLSPVAEVLFYFTMRVFALNADEAVLVLGWDPADYVRVCLIGISSTTEHSSGSGHVSAVGNDATRSSADPRTPSLQEESEGAIRCKLVEEGSHFLRTSRGSMLQR